ncbi:transmembrane epididymal protein 1A-like [Heterocephalus glaber]|uniref:Transmembrane epididymal protein 1A-like n=1 Tax=Heterocephalus glaber TaxID=10181 RepID=A0AAX6SV49_HETGA|nr:transmembrane epididymal protein 1A-like [Heterocephalus glaber]XP_012924340.1 transmembrane epididymal protein 1A-like [Heterocephalus glaber]XP_021111730.1 transmembrane epididymal protein 1A-like [Heterocephalus glaber]
MGTLVGHLLPAIGFLLISLYYAVLLSLALLRGHRVLKPPLPPKEKRGHSLWQREPLEGMVKVVFTFTGILGELFYPPGVNRTRLVDWDDPQRPFLFKDGWQHITMYSFFMFSGVVDIVSQRCLARQNVKLERAAEALAFYVVVLLMATHIENKNTLEIRVHVLFMVPTFLLALMLNIEVWVPDQLALWVLKTWMVLVLSSWLLQLCVVLYAPPSGQPWRADSPTDMAFLTTFFCWHLGLMALLLAAIYGLCSLWVRRYSSWMASPGVKYKMCPTEASREELERLRQEDELQDGGV